MGKALEKKLFYSKEEYLEMEAAADYKSEYYNGEIESNLKLDILDKTLVFQSLDDETALREIYHKIRIEEK